MYEDRALVEGAEGKGGLRCIEDDDKGVMGRSIGALGWGRWKKVYVRYVVNRLSIMIKRAEVMSSSFRGNDGRFEEPVYTIPDLDDEEPNGKEDQQET